MLGIRVTMEGDKAVIAGLEKAAKEMPGAIQAGLFRIVEKANEEAVNLLSGPGNPSARGRKYTRGGKTFRRTRARGQSASLQGKPGSYPVPVLTGWLRRMQGFVPPGETKTANGITFRAGRFEAILYNAAEYANVIHEGTRSSAKYGRRPFHTDAIQKVPMAQIMEEEIGKALPK